MPAFKAISLTNRSRSEAENGFNHKLEDWSLSDWTTALCGEVGELANIVKKLNRARDGIPGNKETEEELREALEDEIADVFLYLDLIAQREGINLELAIVAKFNATSRKIGAPHRLAMNKSFD